MSNSMMMLAALATAVSPAAFWEAIKAKDADAVEKLLEQDPSLASAKSPKGTSAVSAALFALTGQGFLPPAENKMLAAVLRRKPALSPLELCAVGTAALVNSELARDPAFAKSRVGLGWTPLHAAAFAGNTEVAALLLEHGAEVNARADNKFKNSPLQVGLLTAQLEMTRLLIAKGADVNQKQALGFTPLQEPSLAGNERLIEVLLAAGADLNARADDGRTALDEAIRGKHDGAVKLLRGKGAVIGLPDAGSPE